MNRLRLYLTFALCAALAGCHGKTGGTGTDNKLAYSPEVNEVEVITLKKETFPMQLVANGKLSARQKSDLYFSGSGTISQIGVRNGSRVAKGEVLARLDDQEQRSQMEKARIERDKARLEYLDVLAGLGYAVADSASVPEDVRELAGIRAGYSSALNSYDDARRTLEGTVLYAPFSGKVANVKLKKWDKTGSDAFCTLIDDSSYDVNFSALESEYSFLEEGEKVSVTPFGDTRSFEGTVRDINPVIDDNGQIAVTATMSGSSRLLDGMNVKITVDRSLPSQLVVPKSAVVIRDGMDVLFRYRGRKAEWVYVNVLNSNSVSYSVSANTDRGAVLSEGDQIIVSGNLNLADGSQVVVKEQGSHAE